MGDISAVKKGDLTIKNPSNWFLKNAEYPVTASHFEYLINGKAAFERLYKELESAQKTIDIAIWGFQPSMYFIRDGKSSCIGDLLIEKAKKGVKVRILIWAMNGHLQTAVEANMGNTSNAFKQSVDGVNNHQKDYDRAWYYAIGYDKTNPSPLASVPVNRLMRLFPHLAEFKKNPIRTNLMFNVRNVKFQINNYVDDLSFITKALLFGAASHHQKSVLIDYEFPKLAKGFVLEHNMLDNYWDNNNHSTAAIDPNKGKNVPTPLQDTSSFVKGPILHNMNDNFCQSWDREANEGLWGKRKESVKNKFIDYKVNNPIAIQLLRTYDSPNREEIKKIYLQNIVKTTSYIYTENQYFRWPPLVERFKQQWKAMKAAGRKEPIYWFVITNSTDAGIGPGVVNSDRMFKALGRRDVMPIVVTKRTPEDADDKNIQKRYETTKVDGSGVISKYDTTRNSNSIPTYAELERKAQPPKYGGRTAEEVQRISNAHKDAKEKLPTAQEHFGKTLFKDLSSEIGIKSHICVLYSMYSKGKDWRAENWQEVYIHSKVTMINDVFLTMGSANINSRSMQGDTELNLALEHGETVRKLRKDLWKINTNSTKANPDNMHLNSTAKSVFDEWENLIKKNSSLKKSGQKPQQPLSGFLRLSPEIKDQD